MDNLYQNNINHTDSDYSSSSESSEDIDLNNIDYTNKYFVNNTLQSDYLEKRNELFTKDIIRQRILIDTHNIKITGTDTLNTNNYTYYLNDIEKEGRLENYNETGGYDRYKNVIGFRFIKAIIPNRTYTINSTNNIVIIELGDTALHTDITTSDRNKQIKITLSSGFYTTTTLITAFDSINGATYEWVDNDNPTTPEVDLKTTYLITTSFNNTTKLFTFIIPLTYNFKFIYDDNSNEGSRNLLGFTGNSISLTSVVAHQPPDMSVHYFDIVIPEIPYITCKHNTDRKHIIERIPITSSNDNLLVYEDLTYEREDQNFFFPISLSKLNIQLYQKNGHLFNNNNKHHSLEFEITMKIK